MGTAALGCPAAHVYRAAVHQQCPLNILNASTTVEERRFSAA